MRGHVAIVGGGVIGLSTAYYCAKAGYSVTVIDRNPPARNGCSFGNAGMVVPSHFIPLAAPGMVALGLKWMWNPESPFYIRPRFDAQLFEWGWRFWQASTAERVQKAAPLLRDISLASRAAFEELAALPHFDFGLVKKGLLMLCRSQHALDEEAHTAAQARALGIPADVLDARQTAALDPAITMTVAGSVHFPQDCHLSPDRFMAGLQHELERLGCHFRWKAEVRGWQTEHGRVRAAWVDGEALEADEFVLCGGSWSPQTTAQLGLNLPIQAGKGYSLTLRQPRELPNLCSIFTEARVAITPMNGQLRFGGTMEIGGLNDTINPVRVRGIIKSVPKYFPRFEESDFEGVEPWFGLRPVPPDGLPYIGRTKRLANLSLATGHGMMGISLAPITGQLIADTLTGARPRFDLSLLSPDRHSG